MKPHILLWYIFREVLSLPITAGKHSPSDEHSKDSNRSGERDSSRSPPAFHKDNLQQQTSIDSSSPLSGRKLSVISSVSSSISQSSKSPSVGKKLSVTSQTSDIKPTSTPTSFVSETDHSQGKKLPVSHSSTQNHSKDEVDGSSFKTPLTPPPVPSHKPIVPPKPGSSNKPTTPPKPGPKPLSHQISGSSFWLCKSILIS